MGDSGMFENPFREGGKLSRDAEVIIDALKTGKLSVISNQGNEEVDRGKNEDSEELLGSSNDLNSGLLVEPRERKKGEVKANGDVILQQVWAVQVEDVFVFVHPNLSCSGRVDSVSVLVARKRIGVEVAEDVTHP